MASKKTSKTSKKNSLPPVAAKRLKPFIDRGIANGIFADDSSVVAMFKAKATDASLKETLDSLGGLKSEIGQAFITDIVLTDLTSILRQKRYGAHMKVWSVSHNTVGAASGNPRQVCNIFGQVVMEDGDELMESSLFQMSLWDADASIGDDVEADGIYMASVSCKNLNNAVLDLRPLSGLTAFKPEDYEHDDSVELLKDSYEVSPIAELEDDLSRGRNDYRLVEATVSFSGVQNSRSGNQFGKMLLKDESTMTLEAIESGENLLLNCICSPKSQPDSANTAKSSLSSPPRCKANGDCRPTSPSLSLSSSLLHLNPKSPPRTRRKTTHPRISRTQSALTTTRMMMTILPMPRKPHRKPL